MNEFLWPIRVYYEDTDSGGIVYYANYLKFMERARTEWLRSLGIEQDELIRTEGVIFAVTSVQLDYLQPARFNDALTVSVGVKQQAKASLTLAQKITKKGSDDVLCAGTIKIASLNASTFKPRAIPQIMLEKIKSNIKSGE